MITSTKEISGFSDNVKGKGLGFLLGFIPKENETKTQFKGRVLGYAENNSAIFSYYNDILQATEDEVWGDNHVT